MTRTIADSAFVIGTDSPPPSLHTTSVGTPVTTELPDVVTAARERLDIDRAAPGLRHLPVIR